ncbi:MAG: hypothetical protein CM1200mP30_22560 [Pseudomonadota bacterium]|nr:MAG: hypothetical protein CM1200mP30_22560 [Pseudomonadota bacterium]
MEFAGTVIGFQMGLAMANVLDPQSQEQISLVGRFESVTATLIFLAMDGHLIFVQAMVGAIQFPFLQAVPISTSL